MDSAEIAGVECLGLLNDHNAIARAYSFSKQKEISKADGIWRNVGFIDLGYSSFSMSVVEFGSEKGRVIVAEADRNIGARNLDLTVL